ncbi:MAG: hypothetical protein JOZ35_18105 [Hyphomicrobiales bacterium]|nr:hypothetical protein [Hyphomicrobiales bacterium]MBV8288830.1 hypothetical protein [Hyphomicrobiales bacterium]
MTSHLEIFEACSFATVARAVAAACALCLAASAPAQELRPPGDIPSPQPSGPAANPSAAPAPDSVFQPGFVDAIGHWLNESTTRFRTDLQGTQATFDQLAKDTRDVAKDATEAVMGLPNARIVTVRERCAAAQNGAPDCQAAAAAACRGKGFQTGKSVDTQSEHKCPAQVLLKGRAPNDAECSTEIFVTRAVCQ